MPEKFEKKLAKCRGKFFPMILRKDFIVKTISEPEFDAFIKKNFQRVFSDTSPQLLKATQLPASRQKALSEIKAKFLTTHYERLFVYHKKKVVGWFMGETNDPSTFYLRNAGLFPEYRQKGLYNLFVPKFLQYLKELGYERVSAHHHPNNRAVLIAQLKMGFVLNGLSLDERHGPFIHTCYFMYPDREKAFEKAFSLRA